MPQGVPKIGSHTYEPKSSSSSALAELTNTPAPVELGTIDPEKLNLKTELPPPPWEVDARYQKHNTDARKFVTVPPEWELRWLNPEIVRREGLRDWQAVAANDPRVKVHNRIGMVAPDNTIRKGGHDGPFLAWMYRNWVESRARIKQERVDQMSRSSRDRQDALRGRFGRMVQVESAIHPSHTQADGRSLDKD